MLCKTENDNYVILKDGEHLPIMISKPETDDALQALIDCFENINKLLLDMYYNNYELYSMLGDKIYDCDLSEGHSRKVDWLIYEIKALQDALKVQDDEIPSYKESVLLSDMGYIKDFYTDIVWTKRIEDTEEQEIVEEILLLHIPIRRLRTIKWIIEKGSKSSDTIIYEELPIDDELADAIKNTVKYVKNIGD